MKNFLDFIKKHPLSIAAALFGIIVVVIIILYVIDSGKTASLEALIAPSNATITINGKSYKNGTYRVEPGTFTAKIEKEGFTSKELSVELQSGKTTKVYDYLVPLDGDMSWYKNHPEEALLLNSVGDAKADYNSKTYVKKYPVIDVLPIIYAKYSDDYSTYTEFRIDGGEFDDCPEKFCIKITDTTGGNYDFALDILHQKGFNPDDYKILYEYKPIEPLS